MNYYQEQENKANEMLAAALALPSIDGPDYSAGECFDPWEMFPSLYGTYSSEFDTMAIEVLTDIQDNTHNRRDLAAQMFREMLCTAGFCDYGTSPRTCFPTSGFADKLPRLIERWKEYSEIIWK